ncbi:MAG: hypothetical protein PHW73_01705 [Atribacterota bacterium]|nr:hypothetical protein [Atribacterota bacterium]
MENHKFGGLYIDGEWLDGFQIIDTNWDRGGICRRCGESFTKKYEEQIFCSRKCVSRYRKKVKAMKEKYGDAFTKWWNRIQSPEIDIMDMEDYEDE